MHHGEQIPAIVKMAKNVVADMSIAAVVGGFDITGPCIMASCLKRAPDYTGSLTGD